MSTPPSPTSREPQANALSVAKYRKRAPGYDHTVGPTWAIRERAIEALQLQPGQSVLDVGCGTGLSLQALRQAVGDAGRVHGFDQSPDMLALAHQRVAAAGWRNVHLQECPAQAVALHEPVDALLFHYTHDVLRCHASINQLVACGRPGARVSIAGVKFFKGLLAPLNPWVYYKNYGYNSTPGQLASPWDRIVDHIEDWEWAPTQFGMGYLASGRLRNTVPKGAAINGKAHGPAHAHAHAPCINNAVAAGGVAKAAVSSMPGVRVGAAP